MVASQQRGPLPLSKKASPHNKDRITKHLTTGTKSAPYKESRRVEPRQGCAIAIMALAPPEKMNPTSSLKTRSAKRMDRYFLCPKKGTGRA